MMKKYSIAKCSLGVVGMITSDGMVDVTYADGNVGQAYTGIVLEDIEIDGVGGHKGRKIQVKAGDKWSSRNPTLVEGYDLSKVPSEIPNRQALRH